MSRADLIQQVMPSVVNVSTVLLSQVPKTRSAQDLTVDAPGSFATAHGFGSGFVIDGSGLIVTNRHVVETAVRITVTLQDETTLPARIVGRLSGADVALLQVNPEKPLPALRWGNSDKVRVGDNVIAIGNPLGLGGSVSSGIVSGLNRDIRTTPFDDFIQTDAAINHGNSGGPLFDMRGLVVGINTSIYSPTDTSGSIGISFALPAQVAEFIVDETRRYGRVRAGWIGLRLQTVTPDLADALGADGLRGAIVLGAYPHSSGAAAGLRRGDVITAVGDEQPQDSRALLREVAVAPLHQTIPVRYWRQGTMLSATPVVDVLEDPPNSEMAAAAAARREAVIPYDPGFRLARLTEETRARWNLPKSSRGVLVSAVSAYSPADTRGIVAGDVILQIDQQDVTGPAEVDARIADARRQQREYLLLLVGGPGGERFVGLPMHPGDKAPMAPKPQSKTASGH